MGVHCVEQCFLHLKVLFPTLYPYVRRNAYKVYACTFPGAMFSAPGGARGPRVRLGRALPARVRAALPARQVALLPGPARHAALLNLKPSYPVKQKKKTTNFVILQIVHRHS